MFQGDEPAGDVEQGGPFFGKCAAFSSTDGSYVRRDAQGMAPDNSKTRNAVFQLLEKLESPRVERTPNLPNSNEGISHGGPNRICF
jgi:hypothetical protein